MPNYEMILSRDSYLLAIELRGYWAVAAIYGLSLILFIFHILTSHQGVGRAARALIWAAGALNVALVAFRAFEAGRAPVYSGYERLALFSMAVTVTYLFAARRFPKIYTPGVFVSALGFGASVTALLIASPGAGPVAPELESCWFVWHAALATVSYSVLAVSGSLEASAAASGGLLRRGAPGAIAADAELVEGLRAYAHRLVIFAFPLLSISVLAGAAWADAAWGGYLSLTPGLTLPLITLTVFAVYLHSMAVPALRGSLGPALNLAGLACLAGTLLWASWLERLLGAAGLYIYQG